MRGWCLVKFMFRGKEENARLNMPITDDGAPDENGITKTLRFLLDDSVVFVGAERCSEPERVRIDTGWSDV